MSKWFGVLLAGIWATAEGAQAPNLEALIIDAKQDLAQRLAMEVDDVELVDALETVWPDSSAGCPRPRVAYLQVLTAGARITLRAGDLSYRYHSADGRKPFLCERLTWPVRVHERPACGGAARCPARELVVENGR